MFVGLGDILPETSCPFVSILFWYQLYFLCLYIYGFEEVDYTYIEGFPLNYLFGVGEGEFGGFPVGMLLLGAIMFYIYLLWEK